MQPTDPLRHKYAITAWFYDLLNYPWERQYKQWRPQIVGDATGKVLEIGVGTGKNLPYYPANADVTAIDLSAAMLFQAKQQLRHVKCQVKFLQQDAMNMQDIASSSMDWVISTFAFCLMPKEVQTRVIAQIQRVLKPGGQFRILEIVYSQSATLKRRQARFAALIEYVYGARFDRKTLAHLSAALGLQVTHTRFLKQDTYLLIEGRRL